MFKIIKAKNKNNQKFIDILTEYAYYIEVESNTLEDFKDKVRNSYRLKAVSYAVQLISKLAEDILDGNTLMLYPGIGKKTAEKINEILHTHKLKELEKIKAKLGAFVKTNQTINELTEVIGIGKTIAKELVGKHKIKSLQDLKARVSKGEIKVNDKILLGLKYSGKFKGNIPREEIDKIYQVLHHNGALMELETLICGSYRRGLLTSNDIDVLVSTPKLQTLDDVKRSSLLKEYVALLKQHKLIVDDITGEEIITKYMGFCRLDKKRPIRRIDVRLIPLESIHTAMLYFTGSYELNRIMRSNAKKLGYKLNEYGIYKNNKRLAVQSEEDVFKLLGMEYLSPEQRNII